MKKPLHLPTKYSVILIVVFLIFWSIPVEFGSEKNFFQGFLIEKPIIRVGLGTNLSNIKIRSSSGMKVYEVNSHYKLLADDVEEVHIKGHKEKLTEKFVLQIAQAREREEAERVAQDIRAKIEKKVYVTESKSSDTFQVKVGDFLTRGDALRFIKTLNSIGIKDTWILREEVTAQSAKPLWILVNDELENLKGETILYFIPSNKQSYLSFKGRDYRGIFILKGSRKGLVLINLLSLENYLKSVVPSEFSPYNFNEIEAHKALAVAARTYAIKNQNANIGLGFDLWDTPKSQFYMGMSAEHPLSSEAVEKTRGEVVVYRSKLINALYTSTCGGMTENVENIFEGQTLPYLKSTECSYEKQKEWLLESSNVVLPVWVRRRNISREIGYLMSLKIIPSVYDSAFYREYTSYEEVSGWIQKALVFLGKKGEIPLPEKPASSLGTVVFANLVVKAFGWQDRVSNLLLQSEANYVLRDLPEIKEEDKSNVAYLVLEEIFPAPREEGNTGKPLTRAEAAFYLARILSSYRDLYQKGIFKGAKENVIEVEENQEKKFLSLSPHVLLLRNNGDQNSFVSHLSFLGGEDIRWVEKEGEVQLVEVVFPPYANTLDRHSIFRRWQKRKSREELERRINQFYPVGRLIDIVPLKRGVSNRVIELLITGTESQAVVTGLKIRYVLGLKETLFVMDKEYDAEERITHFIFSGRGWGHGVGLCQVGAYGMAVAGADYKEILKKYYQGVKIKKIY